LLVANGNADGAWVALGAALQDATAPDTVAQARFQHGSLAAERGEVEIALHDLRAAAEAAATAGDRQLETQARLNLGVALNASDRAVEAAAAFKHAAELAGGGPLAQLAWHNLARLHVAADQPQAAIEAFERAATAAEDDRNARADAFLARGNALLRWGRYVEADADFTRVLALQPTDALQAQARYSRGLTRSMLGQLERAREDLTITIAGARDRDQRAQALLDRGLVALAAGDFDGAEHDLGEAAQTFRRRASRAVVHVHLAVIQAQQGRCDAAAAQLRLAFELDRAGDALELARHEPRLRLCEDTPGFPLALVARDE
jgi:tetratricopeptide (TPR) repeat protein